MSGQMRLTIVVRGLSLSEPMAEIQATPQCRNLLAVALWHPPRALRLRGERPRQYPKSHPAKESTPIHHRMISSARTKSD